MARDKRDFKKEVEEGLQEHEYRKNIRKKNSLSKLNLKNVMLNLHLNKMIYIKV